jgi:anaerobic selenocysteine-containing dehydrogenase
VVAPVLDTRDPADVLLDLAHRLGGPLSEALPWPDYQSLVAHRLEALQLDWDKLEANGCWSEMVYFNARPGSPAWGDVVGRDRLAAPRDGRFDFFARELFAALPGAPDETYLPHFAVPPALAEESGEAADYPFLLVAQPLMPHTRNWQGVLPSLQETFGLQTGLEWTSWVELNPRPAQALGLKAGDWAWVESPVGRVKATVRLFEGLWPNAVFVPAGQGHHTLVPWGRHSPPALLVGVNPNLLAFQGTETLVGQVAAGPTRVRVYPA